MEVPMARAGKFLVRTGRGGKTHFVVLASNGRVVVTSEAYESRQACLKGIEAVKRLAADAPVSEEPVKAAAASKNTRTPSTKIPAFG